MNRLVAIKVLHARFAGRDDLVARFRREARAMSQLSHPNTARVYKFGQLPDGSAYFVMDYMEGKNLAHAVREQGPMESDRAIQIMLQVCGALEEAHRAGIIHRDLKPENIFLTQQAGNSDFPKVLDFGLAKVSEKQMGRGSMMLTQQGMVFGTPEFMSPEQTQGDTLDRRSDIYSLGLILYELLTGKLPFDATKPIDIMRAHVQDTPLPLNGRVPGRSFSASLDAAIAKAIAKKKDDRYATTLDFADALKKCLSNAGPASGRPGPIAPPPSGAPPAGTSTQSAPSGASSMKTSVQRSGEATDPPMVPVRRGPMIALAVGAACLVLAVGIWLGSFVGP
jgi:serine/threonine-protein kinase